MTFTHLYVRNGKVIIPTVVRTEAGFYIDINPVAVIDVKDTEALKSTLLATLQMHNPKVPTPQQQEEPGSVILETLGIKRWEAFERGAVFYTIHQGTGSIDIYTTGRGTDGMWIQDKGKHKVFDLSTPLLPVVNSIIEDMLAQPEAVRTEPKLPMLLPPPEKS